MFFDEKLYSKKEIESLQELHGAASTAPAQGIAQIQQELTKNLSLNYRYLLLLILAKACCNDLRYNEAEVHLQDADELIAPGTQESMYYYLTRIGLNTGRKDFTATFAIALEQLKRDDLAPFDRGNFLLELCVAYRASGLIKEALQTAIDVCTLWRQGGIPKALRARAEHNVGNLYGELGMWEESLVHIETALELYREVGDISGQARVHNGIGVYFLMSSAYEIAIESYVESERLYKNLGNERRALSVRGNIAFCYHEMGKYEDAVLTMTQVASGYHKLGDMHNYTRATVNLAVLLSEYDVLQAEEIVLRPDLEPHLDRIMKGAKALVLAAAASQRGEFSACVEFAMQTVSMCEQTGYDQYQQRSFELIANALYQQDDAPRAYEYQQRAYQYARDQHRRQIEAQRRALTLKLQRERIEHERAMLQAEVEQKQKELTATTLKLVERSKLMGVVTEHLRELREHVSDRNKSLVSQTLLLIENQSGNVWEAFEQSFNEMTNRFFNVLAERHPNLSPTEQRIAGLLRAGLSTKEIATAMYVSTRTVETHRYRLRKKLSSAGAVDIIAYLQQLDAASDEDHTEETPAQ